MIRQPRMVAKFGNKLSMRSSYWCSKVRQDDLQELPEEQTHQFRPYMAASADQNTISKLIALETGKASG